VWKVKRKKKMTPSEQKAEECRSYRGGRPGGGGKGKWKQRSGSLKVRCQEIGGGNIKISRPKMQKRCKEETTYEKENAKGKHRPATTQQRGHTSTNIHQGQGIPQRAENPKKNSMWVRKMGRTAEGKRPYGTATGKSKKGTLRRMRRQKGSNKKKKTSKEARKGAQLSQKDTTKT